MENDDSLLLTRLRYGENEAVGDAFTRHGRMVYNVCCRVLHDRAAAEDALQETFLVLHRKATMLTASTVLASWLYRTGQLVARDALRSKSRRTRREHTMGNQTAMPNDPPEKAWEEICPHIDGVLAELPERLRGPIVLMYLEGKSVREAAELLKVPEGTVKSRVFRGLEALRARLTPATASLSVTALTTLLAAHSNELFVPLAVQNAVLESVRRQPAMAVKSKAAQHMLGKASGIGVVAALALVSVIGYRLFTTPAAGVPVRPVLPVATVAQSAPHTFYVNPAGDDAKDGTSAETAWSSLAKVNAAVFAPDDRILFQRGGEWRESLIASSNGAEGKPIVYGAYGVGAKPKFLGSEILRNDLFQAETPGNYSYAIAKPVGAVLVDHAAGPEGKWILRAETGKLESADGLFEWVEGRLRIHSATDPRKNGRVYTACVRENAISSNGKSHLEFDDLCADETAINEGAGIRIAGGSDVLVDRCDAFHGGGRLIAAVNVDKFTGRGLHAAYAQPNPQQSYFLMSYCDLQGATVSNRWIDCISDHCENPTHRNHFALSTSGPGLGVISIENLTASEGQVTLGHNLSPNWNDAAHPYAIQFHGGKIENAPLEIFACHILVDGVTISGENGCIDMFGSDNVIQNTQLVDISPRNGGTTGYSTAILCRQQARRNLIRYCTVVVADGASCLTLGGPGLLTQWYGNILISPKLVLNFDGTANAQDVAQADYNFYSPDSQFTLKGLSLIQWRQSFDSHSLSGEPAFTRSGSGILKPLPRSPALHALEIPEAMRIPADIHGAPRSGKLCDLGAFSGN